MQKLMGKSKIRPPHKIVTHEDFSLKLGTRDYVVDITHRATFGSNRSCPFCFITRPGRTVAPILTLNGSNDVFPPKDGPFGGQDDG